jgi:hypothetical protein
MSPAQRQAAFDRFFTSLARRCSQRLGLGYAGTIRKLPPPPLPGESPGTTRYYLNAVAAGLGIRASSSSAARLMPPYAGPRSGRRRERDRRPSRPRI